MVGSNKDRGKRWRPGVEDHGWSSTGRVLDGRTIDRVMLCAVCTMHKEARRAGFSRFGLKTGGFGFLGLVLKIGKYGLVIWASKSPRLFLGLDFKTKWAMVC
jgi:hypothetical protein